MNIIEQLKQNEKPFGLMTAEVQLNMRAIHSQKEGRVSYFDGEHWGVKTGGLNFDTQKTYRLRPDYEEQPEVVVVPVALVKEAISGLQEFLDNCGFGVKNEPKP